MQGATHPHTCVEHASIACVATARAWPIHLTPRAWSIHLVVLHVKLHVQLPCTATPRASVDTQLAGWLTPRSEPMQQATSSFSVQSPDFDHSGEFSSRDQSKIFFYTLSDAQNNLNKLHLISEVEGLYVLSLRLPRKIS
ncbi:unnamed protein product [Brassica rapa]|uniref:Uncharacterized protein n=1 Tax=Brassica campestris TaxID=3711 RepID=A0A8D9G068_BRACM|nr:unnamed protein product [Brassica rapa]